MPAKPIEKQQEQQQRTASTVKIHLASRASVRHLILRFVQPLSFWNMNQKCWSIYVIPNLLALCAHAAKLCTFRHVHFGIKKWQQIRGLPEICLLSEYHWTNYAMFFSAHDKFSNSFRASADKKTNCDANMVDIHETHFSLLIWYHLIADLCKTEQKLVHQIQ